MKKLLTHLVGAALTLCIYYNYETQLFEAVDIIKDDEQAEKYIPNSLPEFHSHYYAFRAIGYGREQAVAATLAFHAVRPSECQKDSEPEKKQ